MARKIKSTARPASRRKKSGPNIERLAAEQGVQPIHDAHELIGDFWPEHESVDDFLIARRRWQREVREPQR